LPGKSLYLQSVHMLLIYPSCIMRRTKLFGIKREVKKKKKKEQLVTKLDVQIVYIVVI